MSPLDQVLHTLPGRCAVAVRNVPQTLDVFTTHFPRFPVLPGVLILDDVVAVAGLALASEGTQTGRTWVPARCERLRFRHYVRPGDQMEITVDVLAADLEEAMCRATVRVSGRQVATLQKLVLRAGVHEEAPTPALGQEMEHADG
jgi:3-hydroxyacyl-[acyl-carrier-protein] dehydratase